MCVNQKWTIQMKNSIDGVMLPQIDPFDKSVFYVSDGLHSTFSSMRFRKLSIETGKEPSNVLIRDGARCIYCDEEYIYVFLNKRILKLHRSDLTIADEYKERIPRYTDYVNSDGEGIFCLEIIMRILCLYLICGQDAAIERKSAVVAVFLRQKQIRF